MPATTASLDHDKLKQIVIAKWKSAPELWPVKVVSIASLRALECKTGGPLTQMGGYFGVLRAISGRTPEQMEDLLGFHRGYLASGATVWKFKDLPLPHQFELRGYSHLPDGGEFNGQVIRTAPGRPVFVDSQGQLVEFPPGLGVEQWKIVDGLRLDAVEIARLLPGQKFRNPYGKYF